VAESWHMKLLKNRKPVKQGSKKFRFETFRIPCFVGFTKPIAELNLKKVRELEPLNNIIFNYRQTGYEYSEIKLNNSNYV